MVESELHSIDGLFTNRETIDVWLHERMLGFLCPIIAACPKASWLTIGDEGQDGWMLRRYGAQRVTASSITDVRLKLARDSGYLGGIEIRALNAEQLDLPDDAFDFVLCRQAFHHVRRAPLAFYEFMRVARSGFVLIEPMECASTRPLDAIRTVAKMLLRWRKPEYDQFEPAGNFIYRISERDVFRMLTALGLEWFAIKTFNTFYVRSLVAHRRDSLLAQIPVKLGIGLQDVLASCRLMSPGLCAVFVATGPDTEPIRKTLRAAEFRIVSIPKNPYMASANANSSPS